MLTCDMTDPNTRDTSTSSPVRGQGAPGHDPDRALFMLGTDTHAPIRTETPIERRFMAADLFAFQRRRGDFTFSLVMAGLVALLILFFGSETGWHGRKLPSDMLAYTAAQLGMIDAEGRVMRLGKILKQGWVAPLLCLLILLPAAVLNLIASHRNLRRRSRQRMPWRWQYEMGQWMRALEYIGYFILYTLSVPLLGYLVSTIVMGCFLTARLGYRGWRWGMIAVASSFAIVVLFRSVLQIKTPVNIWLYNQLPDDLSSFFKTWF